MKDERLASCFVILCLSVWALTCQAGGWTPIFNGKNLDGWEQTGQAEWTVENGLLVGTQTTGQGGDLISRNTWDDFELRFVYRVEWPANSGVWFRYDKARSKGYQFDILKYKDPVAYSGSLYCPGKLFVTSNLDESLENRDGWNEGSVLAQGKHLVLHLNGHKVGQCDDDTLSNGRIGIQVHGGDGFKGMKVVFQKLEIRPVAEDMELDVAFSAKLDQAVTPLLQDKWGKGTQAIDALEALVAAGLNPVQREALESILLNFLSQPNASFRTHYVALSVLSMMGTERSIPQLQALLPNEQLSQMACNVLEKLPPAPATRALVAALPQARGRTKLGLINCLGVCGDTQALPALTALLQSGDTEQACAAAVALGRTGSAKAIDALRAFKDSGSNAARLAGTDACLRLAEQLTARGQVDEALGLYQGLASPNNPAHVQTAAFRGLVETDTRNGLRLLVTALGDRDPQRSGFAARIAAESTRPGVTQALIEALPTLPVTGKINALKALALRRDVTAQTVVLQAVDVGAEAVSVAALKALGSLGNANAIGHLIHALATGSEAKQAAARQSLDMLSDDKTDRLLLGELAGVKADLQVEIIEALGRRHYTQAVPTMLDLARSDHPQVREAALNYCALFGQQAHVSGFLNLLRGLSNASDIRLAEKTLISVVVQSSDRDATVKQVTEAGKGETIAVRCALIRTLGTLGGAEALAHVRASRDDANQTIRDSATDTLIAWPDAAAMDDLRKLVEQAPDARQKILALRGLIRVIGLPSTRPAQDSFTLYERAWGLAERTPEKKLILSGLAGVSHPDALVWVATCVSDPAVKAEAEVAAVQIGVSLVKTHRSEATAVLRHIQQQTANRELKKKIRGALK